MFDLRGKIALITGARRGMGRADAIALAGQGASVAVADVNLEECQIVAEEINKNDGQAIAIKMDVSSKADINAGFAEIIKTFGRLDIVVNNAGIYEPKPALELSEETWDRTIDINLKGQFLVAQRAAQEMKKNNPTSKGRIINIASIASGQVGIGIAGGVHYSASKGGVLAMTETLAIELAPFGITVNAIAPGAIDTPMARQSDMSKETLAMFLKTIPLGRMGTPEEIAALVVYLASDEASYTTGATFYVDGGWLAA